MITITKPTPGDTVNTWGTTLNAVIDALNMGKLDSFAMAPPIGYSVGPNGMTASAAGTPAFQTQYFNAIDVGPATWNCDGIALNVSTAQVGGTVLVGIYPADPTTGYPDTTKLLASTSPVVTSTGIKSSTWATPIALTPGRYWVAYLSGGSTAPGTAGGLTCLTSSGQVVPMSATTAPGTTTKGLFLSGLTVLKATATLPNAFGINGGSVSPVVQLRRSA